MNTGALIFMLAAWAVVLTILIWSFTKLLRQPPPGEEPMPRGEGPMPPDKNP